jgi:hypothetical protein
MDLLAARQWRKPLEPATGFRQWQKPRPSRAVDGGAGSGGPLAAVAAEEVEKEVVPAAAVGAATGEGRHCRQPERRRRSFFGSRRRRFGGTAAAWVASAEARAIDCDRGDGVDAKGASTRPPLDSSRVTESTPEVREA